MGESPDNQRQQLKRAKNKAQDATNELSDMKQTLDKVLTQNLMLVERVRELEAELKKHQIGLPSI